MNYRTINIGKTERVALKCPTAWYSLIFVLLLYIVLTWLWLCPSWQSHHTPCHQLETAVEYAQQYYLLQQSRESLVQLVGVGGWVPGFLGVNGSVSAALYEYQLGSCPCSQRLESVILGSQANNGCPSQGKNWLSLQLDLIPVMKINAVYH